MIIGQSSVSNRSLKIVTCQGSRLPIVHFGASLQPLRMERLKGITTWMVKLSAMKVDNRGGHVFYPSGVGVLLT